MLVLTLITVGLACLLQLSSSVRLDQSTQQHVFHTRVFSRTHIHLVLLIYVMTPLNLESCVDVINLFIIVPHAECHPVEEPTGVNTGDTNSDL